MTTLYVIGGMLLFSCFTVWLAIKLAGQKAVEQERREAMKDTLDEVRKANEVAANVSSLPADERRKRLQQWARD